MRPSWALIATSALFLLGCSSGGPEIVPPAEAPTVTEASTKATWNFEDHVTSLGVRFKWDDGLAMTVGPPKPFVPSRSAARENRFTTILAFVVKIDNETDKPYNPELAYCSGISGGEPMAPLIDSEKGIKGTPFGRVLPGKSVSYKVAFEVADRRDIQVTCSTGFEYGDITWTTGEYP